MSKINFLNWFTDNLGDAFRTAILNPVMRAVYALYFGVIKAIAWVLDMLTQLFFIFAGIFALFANNLLINIRKTPLGMLVLSGLYVNIFCYAVSHSGLFCNDKINFYDNEE